MTLTIVCICAFLFLSMFATKKTKKTPKQVYRVKRTQDNYDEIKSLLDEAIMMLDEMQGDSNE